MTSTNFEIIRGNTIPLTVTVTSDGTAVNITGYVFYFTMKNKDTDLDQQSVISKKVTTLSDPTHGTMVITLDKNETNVPVRKYVYDIQCVSGAGVVTTLFQGEITVVQNITTRTV